MHINVPVTAVVGTNWKLAGNANIYRYVFKFRTRVTSIQ